MSSREPSQRALLLVAGAVAFSLCASAMAQQKPLTGQMLDGRTSAPAAPESAPAQPTQAQPSHVARQPASTYPTKPAHQARAAAASGNTSSPRAQTRPAQAPMPDYTNMKTAYIQPPPTTDETRSTAFGTPVGIVTHYLLQMQASNQNAVASLPTLGDEASAAYKRYLQSFNHPIPEYFKTMVKSDSGSSQ